MKFRRLIKIVLIVCLLFEALHLSLMLINHAFTSSGIAVLGYHSIVSDEEKDKYWKNNIYVMSVSQFKQQMQYLKDHHFKTLSMNEVYNYYKGKRELNGRNAALTFDDGYENYAKIVEPILKKYHFKGTCFVISHKTLVPNAKKPGVKTYLRQSQLINNDTSQYYSHTYNMHHKVGFKKQLEVATYQAIMHDFKQGRKIISDEYFAYPYGLAGKQARQAVKANHVKLAFSYNEYRNLTRNDDQYFLPRYVMAAGMPNLYFIWQLS